MVKSRKVAVLSSILGANAIKHSWFRSTNGEKLKLTMNVEDLLDRLSIAAFSLELHAEDRAVDTPKVYSFLQIKSYQGGFLIICLMIF